MVQEKSAFLPLLEMTIGKVFNEPQLVRGNTYRIKLPKLDSAYESSYYYYEGECVAHSGALQMTGNGKLVLVKKANTHF
jgi:hypothetical protein